MSKEELAILVIEMREESNPAVLFGCPVINSGTGR